MNVVTPMPIAYGFPTNNAGTDAARRDNAHRESIPAVVQGDKSANEKGVASDQERATKNAFNQPTYEKPFVTLSESESIFANQGQEDAQASQNDAGQQSAGKQDAQAEQQAQEEQKKVTELKARDQEVRTHEQAHAAVGGQYAGSPTYEYERGPDGNRYAVGGEVSIDVSEANDAQQTIQKMQQVKAAALAPAEPSAQDYKVAAQAAQKEQAARSELAQEKSASLQDPTANKAKQVVAGFYASIDSIKTSSIALTA